MKSFELVQRCAYDVLCGSLTGKAILPWGPAGAVERGRWSPASLVPSRFQSGALTPGLGPGQGLGLRATEGRAVATREPSVYRAETVPLGSCLLEFLLYSYPNANIKWPCYK